MFSLGQNMAMIAITSEREGVAQDEWAWNADEMAHAFNPTTGVTAIGDCEDMAFLCGTIYVGAGFDAAIVDAPDHVALLIWLPEFCNETIIGIFLMMTEMLAGFG